jgi:hypothetical protein
LTHQMIGHSQFPGRSRRPKEPVRSCFQTTHNEATSVHSNSSVGCAWSARSHEVVVGSMKLSQVGQFPVAELCVREKRSVRQVNMTISLAFLAPNLVKAAVEGRLPRGIEIERLRDLPTEWSGQFETLGLNPE